MVVRGAWWVRYTAAQRIPNGHHRPFNGKVVRACKKCCALLPLLPGYFPRLSRAHVQARIACGSNGGRGGSGAVVFVHYNLSLLWKGRRKEEAQRSKGSAVASVGL